MEEVGAFGGWRVMLLINDKEREDGFIRILEAGGATIIAKK